MFDKNRFFNNLELILHISELHVHVCIHTLYNYVRDIWF